MVEFLTWNTGAVCVLRVLQAQHVRKVRCWIKCVYDFWKFTWKPRHFRKCNEVNLIQVIMWNESVVLKHIMCMLLITKPFSVLWSSDHPPPSWFFKIHFNIIHLPVHRFSKQYLFYSFTTKTLDAFFCIPYSLNPLWFDHPNIIWWVKQIIKLF